MPAKKKSAVQAPLVEQLKSYNENLQFLHKISQQISEKKPLPQLLNDIMESSKLLMGAEASSLLLYDPAASDPVITARR